MIHGISRSASERFLATSLVLSGSRPTPVRLSVLGSYDQATKFVDQLNRYLVLLGLAAILVGSGLVFFISHTFTRPLGSLVAGVRALEGGDFHHPLDPRGGDEVAELTRAFDRMRTSLLKSQRDLLESEQLATIGRMASSISHDLRHSLAAIVANSEFLCDSHLTPAQREELYQEVRYRRESDDRPHRFPARIRPHPRIAESRLRQRLGNHPAFRAGRPPASPASQPLHRCAVRRAGFRMVRPAQAGTRFVQLALECLRSRSRRSAATSRSRPLKLRIPLRFRSPITVPASLTPSASGCFIPLSATARRTAPGWGWRSCRKSCKITAAKLSWNARSRSRTVFRIVLPGRMQDASRGASESSVDVPSLVPAQRDDASQNSISHPGP